MASSCWIMTDIVENRLYEKVRVFFVSPLICKFNLNYTSGFKWQRQLMFRSKLTMHTAYDRKDNAEPASITALTVSKDHKILYVGE